MLKREQLILTPNSSSRNKLYQLTMPNLRVYSLLAVALAISLRYTWNFYTSKTYCYESLFSLDSPTITPSPNPSFSPRSPSIQAQKAPNCLTISRNGRIASISRSTASSQILPGHVLPGLWDGHGHVLQYGEMLHSVNLFGSASLQNVRERIVTWLSGRTGEGTRENWIRGVGWDQASFDGQFPTAADLEKGALRGKYIMLDRVDVHCIWVSQAVLNILAKPLPESIPGGEIIREPGLGVFCDNAIDLVKPFIPVPSRDKKVGWLKSAMKNLNEVGIVGVHDAGVPPADIELYQELLNDKSFPWTVRIYAMLACTIGNTFCPLDARKISTTDHKLSVRSIKLFADGALGSWGSALIEPYTDKPSQSGSLLVNSTTLTSLAVSWALEGFQVNIHAIGDLANRNTISALKAALVALCPGAKTDAELKKCQHSTARFRIEHSQIMHPDDQARMHALGLIPSIQPTHATSDMSYAERRLGFARTKEEAYKMKSLLPLQPILGSDFPVEPPNPFQGIYAAVTRKSPQTGRGKDGKRDGWFVEEALSVREAIRGFSTNVARGAFLEGVAGELKVGAVADWIVVDREVVGAEGFDEEDLRKTVVRETWVGGKRVFRR